MDVKLSCICQHPLTFVNLSHEDSRDMWIGCEVCEEEILSGGCYTCQRYYCFPCRFNLDSTCASSVNDSLTEQEWGSFKDRKKKKEIQHYSHSHRLTVFNYRKIKEDDYNCYWCEKRLTGTCYGCIRCRFFLHEVCRDKIPRKIIHPFHPSHPLRLHLFDKPDNCCGCGDKIMNGTL
ncbi:hypothetical protein PTKIN_Ptkin01aG0347100 [Pterospermum kingtungense]